MIEHLTQPSKTSCGPTCVAMLVGRSVAHVLNTLLYCRTGTRNGMRVHRTNVAEMIRLLDAYGYDVEPRVNVSGYDFAPLTSDGATVRGLLRVHRARARGRGHRSGWHWCVLADDNVYDPLMSASMEADIWFSEAKTHKLFFYPVTRRQEK